MTVTGAQAYAYTSIELSVVRTTSYASSTAASGESAVAPVGPPPRAAGKADALFVALDTDHDGSITGAEFTEGAKALLSGARDRHHRGRALGKHHGHDDFKESPRLERKLERLFNRVDTDSDGATTKEELLAALEDPTAVSKAGVVSVVSVTYTAIAIRSYSVVEQLASLPSQTSSYQTPNTTPAQAG